MRQKIILIKDNYCGKDLDFTLNIDCIIPKDTLIKISDFVEPSRLNLLFSLKLFNPSSVEYYIHENILRVDDEGEYIESTCFMTTK